MSLKHYKMVCSNTTVARKWVLGVGLRKQSKDVLNKSSKQQNHQRRIVHSQDSESRQTWSRVAAPKRKKWAWGFITLNIKRWNIQDLSVVSQAFLGDSLLNTLSHWERAFLPLSGSLGTVATQLLEICLGYHADSTSIYYYQLMFT